jgi:hypothetical protein
MSSHSHGAAVETKSGTSGVRSAGNIIKGRGDLRWQPLIFNSQCRRHLASSSGAKQGSSDPWRVSHPEQRDLQRGEIQTLGGSYDRLHDATTARFQIRLDKPGKVIGRCP